MSYNVVATENFERKVKRLAKKYKSLKSDLTPVFEQLSELPNLGTSIGNDCYKIRIQITAKGRGKSGGARIITYVRFIKETVYLIDIYDKSEKATLSEKEIIELINAIFE
jgi:mRNA-degrading endonuclease RelE of RelBE toxin-antitoxin system